MKKNGKKSPLRVCMGRVVEHHSPDKHPEAGDALSPLPRGIMLAASDEEEYQRAMEEFKQQQQGKGGQPAPASQPTKRERDNATLDQEIKAAEEGKQVKPKGYFRR